MAATHRITAGAMIAAACAASVAGCALGPNGHKDGAPGPQKAEPARAPGNAVRLIGDGSTAYTGAQPHLPRPQRLKPGEKPPQFVVFSWDGAGEDSQKLFSHFRKVAKANNASMTFFLSGVYMLPEEKRDLYKPPQHSPGSSDIGFNDEKGISDTAFLRRIPNKIHIGYASPEQFHEIFRRVCADAGVAYDAPLVDRMINVMSSQIGEPLRPCIPRDVVRQITWEARYDGVPPQLTPAAMARACQTYFAIPAPDEAGSGERGPGGAAAT